MVRIANFSDDKKYRYSLLRLWDEGKPTAMCIGLNPSTANDEKDDATIRILISALGNLGYGSFYMMNLYALISSVPSKLSESPNPVGEKNDEWIEVVGQRADTIIFCWGAFSQAYYRAKIMKKRFPNAFCFSKNPDGSPWHPRLLHYRSKTYQLTLTKY
jgi:hypothetical protein